MRIAELACKAILNQIKAERRRKKTSPLQSRPTLNQAKAQKKRERGEEGHYFLPFFKKAFSLSGLVMPPLLRVLPSSDAFSKLRPNDSIWMSFAFIFDPFAKHYYYSLPHINTFR
jgi:hypothetical protein